MKKACRWCGAVAILAAIWTGFARGESVTLTPSKDNTLYEDPEGRNSNGAGPGFFAGTSGKGQIQRGLVAFDLSSIPSGSMIESVTLTLFRSNTNDNNPEPQTVELHRVQRNWGEGPSNAGQGGGAGIAAGPGDATWIHTFFPNSFWNTPGGDFDAAVSASRIVEGNGSYTFDSTPGLVADIQAWVNNPGSNFGWLLRGREGVERVSKRFDTRSASNPPQLTVIYTAGPQAGVLEFSQAVYSTDEPAGAATISVIRSGGSEGEVTVSHATEELSASNGADFQGVAGTLTFAPGVTERSFEVPISDDATFEGIESIRLTLSQPAGGATLGNPAEAILTISDEEDLTETLPFAQFGEGVGFFSQITLLNFGDAPVNGRMTIRRDDGSAFPATLNGSVLSDGTLAFSVPPGGSRFFATGGQGTPEGGSVTVASDGPLVGVILFGGEFGLAGVGSSPAFPDGFSGPIETDTTAQINTGVAVQGLEESGVSLTFELLDEEGVVVSTAQRDLPPLGHTALFVDQLEWDPPVDFSSFHGAIRVSSNGAVAATVIQTRPRQFATFPVR